MIQGNGSIQTPIRFVCATRLPREKFLTNTLTGKSIQAVVGSGEIELCLYPENARGLPDVYNEAIDSLLGKDPRILVFIHDDVLLCDFYYPSKIREGLSNWDVVGIAGNKRRLPSQPSWIVSDFLTMSQDDRAYLSGAVGQGDLFPPAYMDIFGPPGQKCLLLDGLLLATNSLTLHKTGVRFDPKFRFHFYDMDFCRQVESAGLTMGTIPLTVVHSSWGSHDQSWREGYGKYIHKWVK